MNMNRVVTGLMVVCIVFLILSAIFNAPFWVTLIALTLVICFSVVLDKC